MVEKVHFLTGSTFEVDVPRGFTEPELRSTITFNGARHINYRPHRQWDAAPDKNSQLVHRFDVNTGFTRVSVYETTDAPPRTLVAFWRLPDGYVSTFIQDPESCGADLEGHMRTIIDNVDVRISRYGLPIIKPKDPVHGGNPGNAIERDHIVYLATAEGTPDRSVTLVREPAWVPEGSGSRTTGPTAQGSATNEHGVTVRVNGFADERTELKKEAERIARTVKPA